MRIWICILIFFGSIIAKGQSTEPKILYQQAFAEQLSMLQAQRPIDFKRAVFLTENAYHKGQLDYSTFSNQIAQTGLLLKSFIQQRRAERFKTAGNWAVFTYMMDSVPMNHFKPCTYDFDDFAGDRDWTKMFVTKLMKTRSGNCHSLPYYYKILCEEIGAKASLALAPNHIYIKHIDEEGKWTNLELTNGGFPRDQWIIKEMAVSVEAIRNEVYMKPLTQKESIAMTLFDLANAYQFQYGYDGFVVQVIDSVVIYFPKCIALYQVKANCYKAFAKAEKNKEKPNQEFLKRNYLAHQQCVQQIDKLGYKDEPKEQYEEWVKSVEAEKRRRGIATKNNNTSTK